MDRTEPNEWGTGARIAALLALGVIATLAAACSSGGGIDTGCGNGSVESPEECDDGNTIDQDACVGDCIAARCGDSLLNVGVEECDDGGTASGDGCSPTCTVESGACIVNDGVYRGATSQGRIFELTAQSGVITKISFVVDLENSTCSSGVGCPGSDQRCQIISFLTGLFVNSPSCTFGTGVPGSCADCPSPTGTDCPLIRGSFLVPTAVAGELKHARTDSVDPDCSQSSGDVTWSATIIPGGTETNCGGSPAAESVQTR